MSSGRGAAFAVPTSDARQPFGQPMPLVIAHRGASGYAPEHTLAAYALAIEMGADFIEPDLVSTRDGVLVARHENEIAGTTDVADRPEFAARKTAKSIDGDRAEGWFTEDFTLAELKTLRARERLPRYRPANCRFDGIFAVPTLREVLELVLAADFRFRLDARAKGLHRPRRIGVYPETKHPTYFRGIGLPLEERLVRELRRAGISRRTDKAFIQSFEVGNLKSLRSLTPLPLIQLLAGDGAPHDLSTAGDPRTYEDLLAPEGLATVALYADGIGVDKRLIIPGAGTPRPASTLVADAHAVGLLVHGWTFRAENVFLPKSFRSVGGEGEQGDLEGEITACLRQGMDGFFTDYSDIGVRARDAFVAARGPGKSGAITSRSPRSDDVDSRS